MTSATPWDPESFRAEIQAVLDEFVDAQAAEYADLGDDATRLVGRRDALRGRRQAVPGDVLLLGLPRRRATPEPGEEAALLRAAAALELLHA